MCVFVCRSSQGNMLLTAGTPSIPLAIGSKKQPGPEGDSVQLNSNRSNVAETCPQQRHSSATVSSAVPIVHLQSSVFLLISGPNNDVFITVWILCLIVKVFGVHPHSWKPHLCSSPVQDMAVVPRAREYKRIAFAL